MRWVSQSATYITSRYETFDEGQGLVVVVGSWHDFHYGHHYHHGHHGHHHDHLQIWDFLWASEPGGCSRQLTWWSQGRRRPGRCQWQKPRIWQIQICHHSLEKQPSHALAYCTFKKMCSKIHCLPILFEHEPVWRTVVPLVHHRRQDSGIGC